MERRRETTGLGQGPTAILTAPHGRRIKLALAAAWMLSVGLGCAYLWSYSARPTAAGAPPTRWPDRTTVALHAEVPTLVLFAHPRCPCTRASLDSLLRIVTLCGQRIAVTVTFLAPGRFPASWAMGELWDLAHAIPGARVGLDPDGIEAARFGIGSSGHVVVYGTDGELAFEGGITPGRGHAGHCHGIQAVVAIAQGAPPEHRSTPSFGCALTESTETASR